MSHTPIRMCVICRRRYAKVDLMRHVVTTDNKWFYDAQYKAKGRGYYVCLDEACKEKFFHHKVGTKRRKGG